MVTLSGVVAQGGDLGRTKKASSARPFAALGQQLRSARERAGLSREEAAAAVGVGLTSLQRYEEGERRAHADVTGKLADLYRVPVAQLIRQDPGLHDPYAQGMLHAAARMSDAVAQVIRDATAGGAEQPRTGSVSAKDVGDVNAHLDAGKSAKAPPKRAQR